MVQSYKIFVNDVLLLITETGDEALINPYFLSETDFKMNVAGSMGLVYENRSGRPCIITATSATHVLGAIKKELQVVVAAGGLVYNEKGDLLMIFRNSKWDLPKGKMEPGEQIEITAVREVTEETGIGNLMILKKLNTSYHIYKDHGNLVLKETHWYKMQSDDKKTLVPQKKEGITEAVWVKKEDIAQKLLNTYGNVKEMLKVVSC
jgi:8-oxo-dGTP pyrophosphatase MutT (NUDIX family)